MLEIIKINDDQIYEVIHIYQISDGRMFSEDLMRVMKKNCDTLLRNGNKYFACNNIQDAHWVDMTYISETDNSGSEIKQIEVKQEI